jgi:hypothetical protein
MKRHIATLVIVHLALAAMAQPVSIRLEAPAHAGQSAVLYRYDDLFTLRLARIADAILDEAGQARISAEVSGTARLRLRIGDVHGDLYARPGSDYRIRVEPPDDRLARTISGTARIDLLFMGLDALDLNALTSDLNARIDEFIAEDLATDQAAGMQALPVVRKDAAAPDSARRPPTLFVMPTWSKARVDSFEARVRHFYREVQDPWFAHYLDYSFAGLRHGPRVNDDELFKHHLASKPVIYDDPEYVRFVRSFFAEQLASADRHHGPALRHALESANLDSLNAVLMRNDFLKDERLRELVMIDLLHQQYHGSVVSASIDSRHGALGILGQVAERSTHPEHRRIAANAVWDLTAMHVGERLPSTRLHGVDGQDVVLDSLLKGPACVAVTAAWCTYCDQEIQGLQQLQLQLGDTVPVVVILLDDRIDDARRYAERHGDGLRWLHAEAERRLRDDWRIVSLPAFYLLNDGVLARSPAPPPSRGLGALLHQAKAGTSRDGRVKVWDD